MNGDKLSKTSAGTHFAVKFFIQDFSSVKISKFFLIYTHLCSGVGWVGGLFYYLLVHSHAKRLYVYGLYHQRPDAPQPDNIVHSHLTI
jgi:hypothetical protein